MKKTAVSVLLILALLSFTVNADFFDVGVDALTKTNSTVFVRGCILFSGNLSCESGILVNATMTSGSTVVSSGTATSRAEGFFEINLTSSVTAGEYTIRLFAQSGNTSLIPPITMPTSSRNVSSANLSFVRNKPPFANGSSFLINVTFDGQPVTAPVLRVFNPNGNISSGWTIDLLYSTEFSRTYNVTIPSNADGKYVIVVEGGAGFLFFVVKTPIVAVADVQDTDNTTKSSFAPSGTVRLVAKVRDDNEPKTNAVVTAYVTKPSSSVATSSLTHSTTTNGTYTSTFTDTSAAGEYKVKIVANVSGRFVESTTFFTVKSMEAKLDIVKDFFFEFGGASSFSAGGQVSFNVLVYDKSNSDSLFKGSTNQSAGYVSCLNMTPVLFKNVQTGAVIPFTSVNITGSLNNYLGQDVCEINFTAPQANGIYQLTVNVSVGNWTVNTTTLATGYLSVQSFVLKASPVSVIGSGNDFLNALVPGENATFEISVRNLSSNGSAVNASLISAINVTKISSLNFVGASDADITNLSYTVAYGSDSTNPRVTIMLPENKTGPFNIEFQATVPGGGVIKGTAFYFAKYIEGFASPSGFFEGGGSGGGGSFKCGGTQTFTIRTYDVKTKQPAKSVAFNSIYEAREEVTGRSIKDLLTITSSSSSDSDGNGNVTISFSSGASFSGFNFFLLNVTTSNGKQDVIPGGFECKTLHFFPMVSGVDSGDFNVGLNSSINISIQNIKNVVNGTPYRVTNGTLRVFGLESYDPSKGRNLYQGPSTNYPLIDGNATVVLSPLNFTLTKWPSGFNGLMLQVCDNKSTSSTSDDVCDFGFGGFRAVSFDTFLDFQGGPPPSQIAPFDNVTLRIMTRTNVTNDANTTITNFKVSVGQPWNGAVVTPVANASKMSDGWNKSTDSGFELWNVTFQIPGSIRKGGNMVTVTVKDYMNETANVEFFFNVVKNTVFVPDGEGIFMTSYMIPSNFMDSSHVNSINLTYGINITVLNATNNTRSKSNFTCGLFGFNTTRFGQSQQTINYNDSIGILILDNGSVNTYDTLVVRNNLTRTIAIANSNNRSLAGVGLPTLYLRKVMDCGFAEIINTNTSFNGWGAGFGGQQRKAVEFAIPIIVKRGNTPRAGITVDVKQIVLQQDFGGGRGGFGFDGFLPESNYTKVPAVTDVNGVAFIRLNISTSGSYGIIWNISGPDGTDAAEFSQVIPVEIKTFNSRGNFDSNPSFRKIITLTNYTEGITGWNNVTRIGNKYFLATWNEMNGEIMHSGVQNITIVLRNMTQSWRTKSPPGGSLSYIPSGEFTEIIFDDDSNVVTNDTTVEDGSTNYPIANNWTETFRTGGDQRNSGFFGSDFAVDGNITNTSLMQILLAASPQGGSTGFLTVTSASSQVAVRVCASTFDRPEKAVVGANITLVAESFGGNGPPMVTNLTITDPFTGGNTESILTGPSGCASFNVSKTGGWSNNNNIRGTITSGGSTERVWVGNVNKMV